jgi:hypothetical protein
VTYLYAGLGMAMLTAIMAIFEMAAGITNLQTFGESANDANYTPDIAGIDKAALDLAVNGLKGWSNPTLDSLCIEINNLIQKEADFALLDNDKYYFRASTAEVVPPLAGCEASAPLESNDSLRHRLVIAPVMHRLDGVLSQVLPPRYTVWSCVTSPLRPRCFYEKSF